jgi:hypothetical protein
VLLNCRRGQNVDLGCMGYMIDSSIAIGRDWRISRASRNPKMQCDGTNALQQTMCGPRTIMLMNSNNNAEIEESSAIGAKLGSQVTKS